MTTDLMAPLPKAWLGYGGFCSRGVVVRICAECPSKAEAERQVREAGMVASHGLCPGCYAAALRRLKLEN